MTKFILSFISVFMIAFSAFSQTTKIAVVDVALIANEIPESKQADEKLKSLQLAYADSIQNMQKNLELEFAEYQKQKNMMPVDKQQATEQSLMMKQQSIQQFYQQTQQEIMVKREEFLKPIREKVIQSIELVAKEDGYSLVLDKSGGVVLYSNDKDDITFRVIDKIKRG